jgi:N-acetylglucosamine-6-phosphate deacetylase
LIKAAESVTDYSQNQRYSKSLGMHIEGPYINSKFPGAQNLKYIRKPDINEIKRISSITKVAIVSLAVEMDGGLDLIKDLGKMNIIPSCAHSGASFADFTAAKASGLKHLTHFCNQMSPLHHREIGLVGAGLLDDDIKLELICDLIHLSSNMIKLVFKCRTTDAIMLITDSMSATCLSDGAYKLGGLDVVVKNSIARLVSNGAIASSTLRYFKGLKNLVELADLPLKDVIRTTSLNQALSLGINNLGKIEKGYVADIVLMDKNFVPQYVIINGAVKNIV